MNELQVGYTSLRVLALIENLERLSSERDNISELDMLFQV